MYLSNIFESKNKTLFKSVKKNNEIDKSEANPKKSGKTDFYMPESDPRLTLWLTKDPEVLQIGRSKRHGRLCTKLGGHACSIGPMWLIMDESGGSNFYEENFKLIFYKL